MTKVLNLNRATYEIKDALSLKENPFFFIVGAGISAGSIPLARDIIKLCEQKVKANNNSESLKNLNGAEEYSKWLETAYPHPASRQHLFRELIENKNITSANFKLAHILAYSKLANIVVTPNFDDLLTRALNLFNTKYIVCDHPETAFKVNNENNDIHIVHVHGTYLSYDCCNLTPEIIQRNKSSETTTNTMASLLERLGENMSPIVVGYSGWENDVIMTSLKKRLQSRRLPYNLYWFCYKASEIDKLPTWLKEHSDVIFVIPEKENKDNKERIKPAIEVKIISGEVEELAEQNIQDIQEDPTLSSHVVFDRLVSSLDLPEPQITENPIDFLTRFIQGSNEDLPESDVFFLGHVIERLNKLKKLEQENEEKDDPNISLFKNIRGFARRSKYNTAAQLIKNLDYKDLDKEIRSELIEVLFSIIVNIDSNEDKNDELQLAICNYFETLILYAQEEINEDKSKTYMALLYQIQSLLFKKNNNDEDYINSLNKIIKLLENDNDPKFYNTLINTHIKKARFLQATKPYEAIEQYKKAQELCKEEISEKNTDEFEFVINNGMANIYAVQREFLKAHAYYDYIIERKDVFKERDVVGAKSNKALTYINQGEFNEAKKLIDEIETEYIESKDEIIQNLVVKGIERKISLLEPNDPMYLILNNKIINHYSHSESKNIKSSVAQAYLKKALYYYKLRDVLTATNDFIKSFEIDKGIAGNNLYYILRRKEIEPSMIPYKMDELIEEPIKNKNPFALINKALYLIENDNDWEQADNLIKEISFEKSEEAISNALNWWRQLSENNDPEGHLVIAWLSRHQLINDPNDLNLEERLEKVNNHYNLPEFMYKRV
ncbi:SIR2 family protein [Priestia megaterium]|uniref:SIR2 family protein n=1 Tax=Priestia megaterium TaxID=1404 RepID=UPI002570B189|nr:SIR2 family protein [Priestia megaterium]WJD83796.1 SIR2 family protein [Priestia megaterium]